MFFTRARGPREITFFPVLRGEVAIPSEDDWTCYVQRNINTEEKVALKRNRRWFDVHRRKKKGGRIKGFLPSRKSSIER